MLRSTVAIFVVVAAILLVFHGNSLVFTNDEGIILEPGQRIVEGQRPYVDFFGYMTPGSYWLQAAAFRCFGISLRAGRVPVILDFAAQCALLFWLIATLGSRLVAWATVVPFFIFQFVTPGLLTPQHRWDSATLATLSMCLCVWGKDRRWPWLGLGGITIALAVLCTPSMALVVIVTALWLFAFPNRRRTVPAYFGGGILAGCVASAYMLQTGIFGPLMDQMRWLQHNYSGVNVVPYGSIISGYGSLFEGATGIDIPIRLGLVTCMALPAVLPVLVLAGWGVQVFRKRVEDRGTILYLLACVVALVIATLPRPDVMHLAFAAVPAYALAGIWISRYLSARASAAVFACVAIWAGLFGMNAIALASKQKVIASPVGPLRVNPEHEANVQRLFATVRQGDKLYVHPYMPLLYFLTQARNPTRFSFLAPGMMTSVEEATVLNELSSDSPKWVLYLPLATSEFMRLFPAAANLNPRFEKLEGWMRENYEPLKDPITVSGYSLWVRK